VPLASLLEGLPGGMPGGGPPSPAPRSVPVSAARPVPSSPPRPSPPQPSGLQPSGPAPVASRPSPPPRPAGTGTPAPAAAGPASPAAAGSAGPSQRDLLVDDVSDTALARFREAFVAEVKRSRSQADWGMVLMPARRIEVAVGSVTFVYESQPKIIAGQFEKMRPGLSELATSLAGRPMAVSCKVEAGPAVAAPSAQQSERDRLKAAAMAEPAVQALLDVYPADIRDVEEVKE
jgi:hypothetical protein